MSTPALDRATEALCTADTSYWHHEQTDDYPCSSCVEKAQTAVSAALHDPDPGRDPVAGTMREHRATEVRDRRTGTYSMRCLCSWQSSWHPWHASSAHVAEHEDHVADAVRAAVLGSGSGVGVDAAPRGL